MIRKHIVIGIPSNYGIRESGDWGLPGTSISISDLHSLLAVLLLEMYCSELQKQQLHWCNHRHLGFPKINIAVDTHEDFFC